MNSLIPVCPPQPELLKHLQGKKVVFRIGSIDLIPGTVDLGQKYDTHIHSLIVLSKVPVADVSFAKEYRDLPVALFSPRLGRFRDLVPRLQILKQMNIRIYLPFDTDQNISGLRILSSLGIASTAVLKHPNIDWERLSDLMVYALLGIVPRAPIDPFQYLADRYSPNARNDFSAVYFDDPSRYVHVDDNGHIALSSRELADRKFIADSISELHFLTENRLYLDRLESWRRFFLQTEGCAFCEAWRICLGKFNSNNGLDHGCSVFFKEFLETIEQYRSLKVKKAELWQP